MLLLFLFCLVIATAEYTAPPTPPAPPFVYNASLAQRMVEYSFSSYTVSNFASVEAWNCSCCHRLQGVRGVQIFNDTERVLFGYTVQEDALLDGAGIVAFR